MSENLPAASGAKTLRIGVDASFLGRDQRGMGRFVRSVLDCWKATSRHEFYLICRHARHLDSLSSYREDGWPVKAASDCPPLDVCFFPWSRVDWSAGCPSSVFIHDVAPFTEFHPKNHLQEDRQRLIDAAEAADQVLTNSSYSRAEIARYLDWPLQDIEVVPLAYDASLFHPLQNVQHSPTLPQALESGNYLLFVGNLEPRKNLLGLLEALELCHKDVTMPLALVCPKPEVSWFQKLQGKSDPINRLSKRLEERLVWLDRSSDIELAKLYRHARIFVMPSLHEGFGLPLLEALACGCICAAAKAASLPEVGGAAPYWFDAKDPVDMARVLSEANKASAEEVGQRRELSVQQAGQFSWEGTAAQILSLLEELASSGRDSLSGEIMLAQEGEIGVVQAGNLLDEQTNEYEV